MLFEEAVANARTRTDLRRVASAHVVDHNQLSDDELRAGVIKVRPQYLHRETVKEELDGVLYGDSRKDHRVLARTILIDVLLEQYDFLLPFAETEQHVIEFERTVVDQSNEIGDANLTSGDRGSQRDRDISLYSFVLRVAWENQDTVSPDEANLLRRLREALRINEWDHRLLEAQLGKYPKPGNELHTRDEINQVRRHLQSVGLLFPVRQEDSVDLDVIPRELAEVLRSILHMEIRTEAYRELLKYRRLRRRTHLTELLDRAKVHYGRGDVVDALVERVVRNVAPSRAIASASPRYGLNSDQLTAWCKELGVPTGGTIEDRVARVVAHFDRLRPRVSAEADEREFWYQFYDELARREYSKLREQHVIEKDLEIEAKFEGATNYLFAAKLNHTPLKQSGSNHPDGLLSLRADYLMWDNKSKESSVSLGEHLSQFDGYMSSADKAVPIFLVIAPAFTDDSEVEATRYHAKHFDRNIVLITAVELKNLAEEWTSPQNKNRDESFPLPMLAAPGRFNRERLGKLW